MAQEEQLSVSEWTNICGDLSCHLSYAYLFSSRRESGADGNSTPLARPAARSGSEGSTNFAEYALEEALLALDCYSSPCTERDRIRLRFAHKLRSCAATALGMESEVADALLAIRGTIIGPIENEEVELDACQRTLAQYRRHRPEQPKEDIKEVWKSAQHANQQTCANAALWCENDKQAPSSMQNSIFQELSDRATSSRIIVNRAFWEFVKVYVYKGYGRTLINSFVGFYREYLQDINGVMAFFVLFLTSVLLLLAIAHGVLHYLIFGTILAPRDLHMDCDVDHKLCFHDDPN